MVYTRVGVWIPQCPPKNWEARSWSGDGRRPSGALHCNWVASLDRACGSSSLLLHLQSGVAPWPWWSWLARSCCRGPWSGRSPGTVGSYSNPDLKQGLLQVNSTLSSIELSFLCLDSIESGGRAGASGLGSLPPSLRVVFSFPWLERRGSVRLLGREPPWSGSPKSALSWPDLQLDPQLDPQLDSARSSSGSSSRKSSSCPTNVYTGGLKSMFSPLTTVVSSGLGRRSLEGPANGCVNLNWNLPSNSLCSMRRLVLQNLMSIQPGSVALYQLGSLQQHTR
ncbi:unnamed protein product [Microthlaspi erraticum]|uniref:Uncharacterized protein n=1 Tax=Microthlaspi erraticum TaxID=1685480 RepID=A0A6D2HTY4_9BRAS|nr:unnamed protein product [Microthlaspi erraticum]